MKPNFETMARAELRTYVKTHSDDEQAFHTSIDRFASTPTEIYSGGAEEVEMFANAIVKRNGVIARKSISVSAKDP